MNFTALKAELAARGFDHLSDTRLGQYVNWGRAELDDLYRWPYREAAVTGTAPLIVTDLGVIEAVTNETSHATLQPADFRGLLEDYGDLSLSGTPSSYYVSWATGVPEVATYPASTNTIGVQYWKVTPDLSAGTDTPLAPTRFHGLIVDLAVRRAYRDRDNHQAAEQLQVEIDRQVQTMIGALLGGQQVQGAGLYMQVTGASEDW